MSLTSFYRKRALCIVSRFLGGGLVASTVIALLRRIGQPYPAGTVSWYGAVGACLLVIVIFLLGLMGSDS